MRWVSQDYWESVAVLTMRNRGRPTSQPCDGTVLHPSIGNLAGYRRRATARLHGAPRGSEPNRRVPSNEVAQRKASGDRAHGRDRPLHGRSPRGRPGRFVRAGPTSTPSDETLRPSPSVSLHPTGPSSHAGRAPRRTASRRTNDRGSRRARCGGRGGHRIGRHAGTTTRPETGRGGRVPKIRRGRSAGRPMSSGRGSLRGRERWQQHQGGSEALRGPVASRRAIGGRRGCDRWPRRRPGDRHTRRVRRMPPHGPS